MLGGQSDHTFHRTSGLSRLPVLGVVLLGIIEVVGGQFDDGVVARSLGRCAIRCLRGFELGDLLGVAFPAFSVPYLPR